MLNIAKYQKVEAIQELQTDYEMMIAMLDAEINLNRERIKHVQERMKLKKSADIKVAGYLRLMKFNKAIHLAEMKRLTYLHYQDGLSDKLKELK